MAKPAPQAPVGQVRSEESRSGVRLTPGQSTRPRRRPKSRPPPSSQATAAVRPPEETTPSGTPRSSSWKRRQPGAQGETHMCPGGSRPGRAPASALTWPVMPVMSATFLGLPVQPSPEPRALGQRSGECAMSPRLERRRKSPGSGAGGRGGVPRASRLAPLQEGANRAAGSHDLTGRSETRRGGQGAGPGGPAAIRWAAA